MRWQRRRPTWHYRHTVLSLCVGAYFAIRTAQLLVSPVIPDIMGTFSISRGTVGVALSGMWVAYALSQLPSGVLGDHWGGRRVVLLALTVTVLGGTGMALAPAPLLFGAVLLLLGIGAGLYYNAATTLLSGQFDAMGRAIGIHRIGSQVAGIAAPAVATAIGAYYGWRVVIAAGVLVTGIVLVSFAWRVRVSERDVPDETVRQALSPRGLLDLLSRPSLAYTSALATLGEFAILSTMSFLPTFLIQHHALSLAHAGLLFSLYFAVVGLLQPVSGWVSDSIGRDRTLLGMFAAGVVGYGLLATTVGFWLAVPAVILVAVGMSWGPPIQSRAFDTLDTAEEGTGFGLVRTIYLLLGALGPTVVGTTADLAGWAVSFLLLSGLLGIAVASLLVNRALKLGW